MLTRKTFALSFVALLILSFGALAQDPAPIYAENYKVITENDRVGRSQSDAASESSG